jgi:hypothetical protein
MEKKVFHKEEVVVVTIILLISFLDQILEVDDAS